MRRGPVSTGVRALQRAFPGGRRPARRGIALDRHPPAATARWIEAQSELASGVIPVARRRIVGQWIEHRLPAARPGSGPSERPRALPGGCPATAPSPADRRRERPRRHLRPRAERRTGSGDPGEGWHRIGVGRRAARPAIQAPLEPCCPASMAARRSEPASARSGGNQRSKILRSSLSAARPGTRGKRAPIRPCCC
jgi:hypothetical protein